MAARKGYIVKEMEKWLKRQGVHPDDIKLAANFMEKAQQRDKKSEKKHKEI